tara:strand:- start:710 stop:886 length:177 start_codon:yes stop_codon:yes gene_type:complete
MSKKENIAYNLLDQQQYEANFGSSYMASLDEMLSIMTGKQYKKYRKKTSLFGRLFRRK